MTEPEVKEEEIPENDNPEVCSKSIEFRKKFEFKTLNFE